MPRWLDRALGVAVVLGCGVLYAKATIERAWRWFAFIQNGVIGPDLDAASRPRPNTGN